MYLDIRTIAMTAITVTITAFNTMYGQALAVPMNSVIIAFIASFHERAATKPKAAVTSAVICFLTSPLSAARPCSNTTRCGC